MLPMYLTLTVERGMSTVWDDNNRFERIYKQGTMNVTEIWVDQKTGVNYIFHQAGYSGGLTPLLGPDGKPVISNEYIR